MNRNVLEFRPNDGNIAQINNPVNNLLSALVSVINSLVDERVNEQVEKRLTEIHNSIKSTAQEAEPQYLKAKELGQIFNFAESTINDMADRGEIPCVRHIKGKKTFRRFELAKVQAVLKS